MKRVLCVVPRPLYPALSGGEIRVLSLLKALSNEYEFTTLTFLKDGAELDCAAAAVALERQAGIRTAFVRRTPGYSPPWADLPSVAASFADPAMERAVAERAKEADLLQLEFTQTLQYAGSAGGLPVVATEHDASVLSPDRTYLRLDAERAAKEAALAKAYLARWLPACARVVCVSKADAARLRALSPEGRYEVVPTGVDLPGFPFAGLEGRTSDEAVFVGHYPHFPNEDAAVRLCRDVLPLLRKLRPGARARLVGSSPTPGVLALGGKDVDVVGTVPAVGPELRRARVFIAPMRLGFGIKGKLLEAFASGLPVVATRGALEAMPGARDGTHALVGDTDRALAEAAARLMSDDKLARRLAKSARAYVEKHFAWELHAEGLRRVYREVLA